MRPTTHFAARLGALVASFAAVMVLVSLPCSMGAEACALAPTAATGAVALCPMAAAHGGRPMECCAKGERPYPANSSNPAAPASPDSGSRLQAKVMPVGTAPVLSLPAAPAVTERPAPACGGILTAPATPLYTLLSTLLS